MASSSPFYLTDGYYYSSELLSHNARLQQQKSKSKSSSSSSLSMLPEDIDFFKNDIFCMGLIVLELGLPNRSIPEIYSFSEGVLYYEVLENLLN